VFCGVPCLSVCCLPLRAAASGPARRRNISSSSSTKSGPDGGTAVPTYSELARELNLASENAANKILLAARRGSFAPRS